MSQQLSSQLGSRKSFAWDNGINPSIGTGYSLGSLLIQGATMPDRLRRKKPALPVAHEVVSGQTPHCGNPLLQALGMRFRNVDLLGWQKDCRCCENRVIQILWQVHFTHRIKRLRKCSLWECPDPEVKPEAVTSLSWIPSAAACIRTSRCDKPLLQVHVMGCRRAKQEEHEGGQCCENSVMQSLRRLNPG